MADVAVKSEFKFVTFSLVIFLRILGIPWCRHFCPTGGEPYPFGGT